MNQVKCSQCVVFQEYNNQLQSKYDKQLKTITELQEKLSSLNKTSSSNNTSISFPLLSEIKYNWEYFSQSLLPEAFECLLDHSQTITTQQIAIQIMQVILKFLIEYSKSLIKRKINDIANSLHIKSSDSSYDELYSQFSNILRQHFSTCFDVINYDSIIAQIKTLLHNNESFQSSMEYIENDLNSSSFIQFCQLMNKLGLYCHLHEPRLFFDIKDKEIIDYSSLKYCNVEGFEKEGRKCQVIISAPLLKGMYSFNQLKNIAITIKENDDTPLLPHKSLPSVFGKSRLNALKNQIEMTSKMKEIPCPKKKTTVNMCQLTKHPPNHNKKKRPTMARTGGIGIGGDGWGMKSNEKLLFAQNSITNIMTESKIIVVMDNKENNNINSSSVGFAKYCSYSGPNSFRDVKKTKK